MAVMTVNDVKEQRRKLRDHNPSKFNMGGPMERAASENDYAKKFDVFVRSDGQGGYCYRDPYNKNTRKFGALDPLGSGSASTFQVDLYQWDKGRAVLGTDDEKLRALETERECIRHCRLRQHNDPLTDGLKLQKFIEKGQLPSTNMDAAYRECFKTDSASRNSAASGGK